MLAYGTMPTAPEPSDASSAGAQLDRLVEIMRILRSPEGCPWDREQTVSSLRPFVLEEAYEVIDAIDAHDTMALRDELGDFVFEAVFVAQLCSEDGQFTLADALASAADKLVRRHPHVFDIDEEQHAGRETKSSADVKRRWEEIKAAEQQSAGQPARLLGGLPTGLPALLKAYRMGRRAATVGFDWERSDAVIEKVEEELGELREAMVGGGSAAVEEELGDLLFAVANLGRHLGVDPEGALRQANHKFLTRFTEIERRFQARGHPLRDATIDEMETEWQQVKRDESARRE